MSSLIPIRIINSDASTSKTTGALICAGGVGVAGDVNCASLSAWGSNNQIRIYDTLDVNKQWSIEVDEDYFKISEIGFGSWLQIAEGGSMYIPKDIALGQITAPGVTADKLYNVGGVLTFNGSAVSTSTVSSGEYIPTVTDVVNCTSVVVEVGQYQRINDIVSFSLQGRYTRTDSTTLTEFSTALPVARISGNFSSIFKGTAVITIHSQPDLNFMGNGYGISRNGDIKMQFKFNSLISTSVPQESFVITGSYTLVN